MFFASWTAAICLDKFALCEHLYSHNEQSKGFLASCSDDMCLFNFPHWEKLFSHKGHLNDFLPSCTAEICLSRLPLCKVLYSQIEHINDFSSSWVAVSTFCPLSKIELSSSWIDGLGTVTEIATLRVASFETAYFSHCYHIHKQYMQVRGL